MTQMRKRNKMRWNDLCGEAQVEEDPGKLRKLAEQITRILDAEQKRLALQDRAPPNVLQSRSEALARR
jgi:hypothetical protein